MVKLTVWCQFIVKLHSLILWTWSSFMKLFDTFNTFLDIQKQFYKKYLKEKWGAKISIKCLVLPFDMHPSSLWSRFSKEKGRFSFVFFVVSRLDKKMNIPDILKAAENPVVHVEALLDFFIILVMKQPSRFFFSSLNLNLKII